MGGLFGGLGGNEPSWDIATTANQHPDQSVLNVWSEVVGPLADRLVCDAKRFGGGGFVPAEHFNGLLFWCHAAILNRSSTRTQPQFS